MNININPEIAAKFDELNSWKTNRVTAYKKWDKQLENLYNDIDAGLFGEAAKTGTFYTSIKNAKTTNPKPTNVDQIMQDIETLIANEE